MAENVNFNSDNDQKKEVEQIQSVTFMVEVFKKPKCEDHFIVRAQAPNGMPVVAVMGFRKDLDLFLDSL